MRAFVRSFRFAWEGIGHVVRTQRNARIHLAIMTVVALLGVLLQVSIVEWAILALTAGTVFAAEMFNTVAELAVDLLTQQYHPMAKIAKDAGAGAVLVTAVAAVLVGIAIFGPRLWALLSP